MFEIGIFCVIVIAIGYWVTLWTMGRRKDVLHGQFVQAEPRVEPVPEPVAVLPSARLLANAAPANPSANAESLQSLLVSIKRELKNAAQM